MQTDEASVVAEKEALVLELMSTIDGMDGKGRGYAQTEVNRARQEAVIRTLPDDFMESLKARRGEIVEQFSKLTNDEELQEMLRGASGGFVFEALVRCDVLILGQLETPAGAELRELIHNPRRFGLLELEQLGRFRNPDIALVDDRGQFEGYTEVKLGLLDDRAYQQLEKSGSKAGFLVVTRFLREHYDKLRDWKLDNLATKKRQDIAVSKERFDRVLVVPANRDIANPANLIKPAAKIGRDDQYREDFERMLKEEIIIKKAAFSVNEVWAVTDTLLKDMASL